MKVIIGMATMPGRERYVKQAMLSLMNNTLRPDDIILYDNGIEPIDLTDNGKFFGLSLYSEPVYYFSTDDDLIYAPDYIEKTIKAIERWQCIVTYHGRQLRGTGLDYYTGHRSFRCLGTEKLDIFIDVCGTGVTAFRTDYFNPVGIHTVEDKRMSDLVFSLEAAKQGKKIIHLAHRQGWIQYQNVPIEQTIYGQEHKRAHRQMEFADEIFKLNHK